MRRGIIKSSIQISAGCTAPVFRSATDEYNGTSQNFVTGNKPSGVVSGDLLVASVYWNDRNQAVTGPSGWTEIASFNTGDPSASASCWYKVAGGAEPVTYTWAGGTVTRRGVTIAAFSGSYAADPVDAAAVITQASPVSAGITTVADCAMVLYFAGFDAGPSGTWSEDTGYTSAGADDGNFSSYIGYKEYPTAGATGTISYGFSGDDTKVWSFLCSFVRND